MIDVQEHVYRDDPEVGPPDVRTRLPGVEYFFLGNGLIQAAVQIAPRGEGSPVGLLIMNPDRLRKKRDALTMDPENGLAATLVRILTGGRSHSPAPGRVRARWDRRSAVPSVALDWRSGTLRVRERFSCPDRTEGAVSREIAVRNAGPLPASGFIETGIRGLRLKTRFALAPGSEKIVSLRYVLDPGRDLVSMEFVRKRSGPPPAAEHWRGLARVVTGDPILDHFFRAATAQLPAAVSRRGVLDGSIWQYNREWCRDQSVIALALAMIGERGPARTILGRLLSEFVTAEGDTVDSSERRDRDEIELDQNGFLLSSLLEYSLWTGDLSLARSHWPRISALAEFPLGVGFRHEPSGLLMNRREFWERHRAHGIQPGLELVHQLYVSRGLEAASRLARRLGEEASSRRWETESRRLLTAMLEDPVFRMVDNRGFIKRRGPDGPVQETIVPEPDSGLPPSSPLAAPGPHFLNPDASSALPLALGVVPPDSPLCTLTLDSLEGLWNQTWSGGGYGRYNATSEPDSPGPWPFASIFVARAAAEAGRPEVVGRVIDWLSSLPGAAAGSWFEFYGERASPPSPQVGIIPWTWAEMIVLVVHHILGLRPDESGLSLHPRLLPGLERVRAEVPFRGRRLRLDYRAAPKSGEVEARLDGRLLKCRERLQYTLGPSWRIEGPF